MSLPSHEGPRKRSHEYPVAPRYSLVDESIHREDKIINGNLVRSRHIQYPDPQGIQLVVRASLISRGLILGRREEAVTGGFSSFEIPMEARPIAYDAKSEVKGAYSYDDSRLFFDLGNLIREVSASLGDGYTVEVVGPIGKNVALTDFTEPDESSLYLVPGIEKYATAVNGSEDALPKYRARLLEEFGPRFESAEANFVEGYELTTH